MGTTTDNYQRKKKLSKSQIKRTERLEKSSHRRYGTRKKEGLNKLLILNHLKLYTIEIFVQN